MISLILIVLMLIIRNKANKLLFAIFLALAFESISGEPTLIPSSCKHGLITSQGNAGSPGLKCTRLVAVHINATPEFKAGSIEKYSVSLMGEVFGP